MTRRREPAQRRREPPERPAATREGPRPRSSPSTPASGSSRASAPAVRFGAPASFLAGLAAIFVAALAVRAAHIAAIGSSPFARLLIGDAKAYDRWARAIAAGDWIGSGTFYQAPLYPYLLAMLDAVVGADPMAVRWAQAVLGSLGCVLLALAGRRWLSAPAGLAAGAILALYPPAVFFDGLVQKAALDSFLMCALLCTLGAYAARGRSKLLPLAGLLLGLFALTRENALVFLALIAVWLPFHLKGRPPLERAGAVALLIGGAALALVPVGARNLAVGGEFLITTSQAGSNFYIGNHEGANGSYIPIRPGREVPEFERTDATEVAQDALGRTLSPGEVSSYWWGRAFAWIRAHPLDWASLLGKKALLTWNRAEIPDTESLEIYREYSPVLNGLAALFGFGLLLALAVPGMVLAWAASPRPVLLHLMLFVFSGAVAFFYVFARYRFPMVPILALFAGATIAALAARLPGRARAEESGSRETYPLSARPAARRPALVGAAVAGAILGLLPPIVPRVSSRRLGYVNLGIGFIDAGDFAHGAEFMRRAIAIAPEIAQPHYNLGRALAALGENDGARAELETTLRLAPEDADTHDELGALLMKEGDFAGAEVQFQEAHRIEPLRATTLANLGSAALARKHPGEAADWFRKAVARTPSVPGSHYYLAVSLTEMGRNDEAAAELEAALRLDPNYAGAHDDLGVLLAKRGDLAGAERHFREAYRIDPARTSTLSNLGSAALAMGRAEEAAAWYRKALALKPDLANVRLNLVQALERLGRREEALAEARELLRVDPANAQARAAADRLAASAERTGRR